MSRFKDIELTYFFDPAVAPVFASLSAADQSRLEYAATLDAARSTTLRAIGVSTSEKARALGFIRVEESSSSGKITLPGRWIHDSDALSLLADIPKLEALANQALAAKRQKTADARLAKAQVARAIKDAHQARLKEIMKSLEPLLKSAFGKRFKLLSRKPSLIDTAQSPTRHLLREDEVIPAPLALAWSGFIKSPNSPSPCLDPTGQALAFRAPLAREALSQNHDPLRFQLAMESVAERSRLALNQWRQFWTDMDAAQALESSGKKAFGEAYAQLSPPLFPDELEWVGREETLAFLTDCKNLCALRPYLAQKLLLDAPLAEPIPDSAEPMPAFFKNFASPELLSWVEGAPGNSFKIDNAFILTCLGGWSECLSAAQKNGSLLGVPLSPQARADLCLWLCETRPELASQALARAERPMNHLWRLKENETHQEGVKRRQRISGMSAFNNKVSHGSSTAFLNLDPLELSQLFQKQSACWSPLLISIRALPSLACASGGLGAEMMDRLLTRASEAPPARHCGGYLWLSSLAVSSDLLKSAHPWLTGSNRFPFDVCEAALALALTRLDVLRAPRDGAWEQDALDGLRSGALSTQIKSFSGGELPFAQLVSERLREREKQAIAQITQIPLDRPSAAEQRLKRL